MIVVDVIKLRILIWGYYPGLSGWVITRIFTWGRQKDWSWEWRDWWYDSGSRDWSDVARSQRMPEASRTWKKQGTDLRLEPVRRNSPANTLILAPSDSFYTLHLSNNITHAHLILIFVESPALGTIFWLYIFAFSGISSLLWIFRVLSCIWRPPIIQN